MPHYRINIVISVTRIIYIKKNLDYLLVPKITTDLTAYPNN